MATAQLYIITKRGFPWPRGQRQVMDGLFFFHGKSDIPMDDEKWGTPYFRKPPTIMTSFVTCGDVSCNFKLHVLPTMNLPSAMEHGP